MLSGAALECVGVDVLAVRDRLVAVCKLARLDPGAAGDPPLSSEVCGPTWVAFAPDDDVVYVPCNKHAEVLELSTGAYEVQRRLPTGRGPYNADVSPDGKYLVVTLKGAQSVAVFDRTTWEETRIPTTQPITHGVAISPDSRYAFVTNEAIGATRGTLDVFDLEHKQRVASVELQHQSGGISFWRMAEREEP